MADTVTMLYGTYNFSPVPLATFTKEYKKSEDGRILSTVTKVTLDGTLISLDGGFSDMLSQKDTLTTALEDNGCPFVLNCVGGTSTNYARVLSLSFKNSQNNWINSVGYTIELEYDDNNAGEITSVDTSKLDSISEEWQIEPIEDKPYVSWNANGTTDTTPYLYKLTHNVSAKGRAIYAGCGTISGEPWRWAADFCSGQVGTQNATGIGLPNGGLYFNHHRTQSIQKYAGTCSIAETWTVFKPSTAGVPSNAIEDFTIDIQQSYDNDTITASIQGNIQGLESNTYSGINVITKSTTGDKYASALTYFSAVTGRLFNRAQQGLYNSLGSGLRPLSPSRINKTIGHNVRNGVITYNFGYNNKPAPCITGALSETININVSYPTEVTSSISVLGRSAGPIMQFMGTRTSYVYNLSIDATMPIINTGCVFTLSAIYSGSPHTQVKTYLNDFEQSLKALDAQVAKTTDNITWSPKEGKYVRNVAWTMTPCSGSGTAINDLW